LSATWTFTGDALQLPGEDVTLIVDTAPTGSAAQEGVAEHEERRRGVLVRLPPLHGPLPEVLLDGDGSLQNCCVRLLGLRRDDGRPVVLDAYDRQSPLNCLRERVSCQRAR